MMNNMITEQCGLNGERDLTPALEAVEQTLKGLSLMLGKRYEVILHDLRHPDSSIIGVEGDVTHRQTGGPVTNFVLQALARYGDDAPNYVNYKNVLVDGRTIRSSTIFIRDSDGKISGCLCVNQDLTDFNVAMSLCEDFIDINDENGQNDLTGDQEFFAKDIREMMGAIVGAELERIQKPLSLLLKTDKLNLVYNLYEKGVFDVKGSVEYIADRLGVTSFTIYNYIKEIRFGRHSMEADG